MVVAGFVRLEGTAEGRFKGEERRWSGDCVGGGWRAVRGAFNGVWCRDVAAARFTAAQVDAMARAGAKARGGARVLCLSLSGFE